MIGRRVGQYEILEKIGEGGMGAVYSALDTSLDRKVALKLLPEEMAADPARFERFQREAKAVAALNHPNIVTIHSVEEVDGVHFLTMELVEGRRLDAVIPAGGLPLERIFEIAIPLAEAVTAAHDKGIVHRDLKPANVMVTPEGRVKVLDFGLAKLAERDGRADATHLPTEAITAEGKVMGTVPYMSPEQVQGRPVDHRSDIFSLGIILYEMCVGVRPFRGDTSADLISSILRDQPSSVTDLKGTLPRHLGRIVRHCLEKEPGARFQTARDVRNELRDLEREVESGEIELTASRETTVAPAPDPKRRTGGTWAVIAIAAAALAGVLWLVGPRPSADEGGEPAAAPAGYVPASEADRTMIVVLPFENLGPAEDEYFADGISEEITSRLASLEGLGTISRASARRYKGNRPPTAELGEALGVDYVLEGTVRWEHVEGGPSRVRVTPELIRVADDTSVWSERYDEELDRIFAVQSAIAEAVAHELDLTLLAGDRAALADAPTENMEAYQSYLRAMELWTQPGFDSERFELAYDLFERAVELDPEFHLAWTQVSQVADMLWVLTNEVSWRDAAKAALDRAEALAPDDYRSLVARGYYHYLGFRDYETALEHFEAAAELAPNDGDVLQGIAFVYRRQGGRLPEAEAYLRRAFELDPQSAHLASELGRTIAAQRRFEEADEYLARAISLAPQEPEMWENRARIHFLHTGDAAGAREIIGGMPGLWEGDQDLVESDALARDWESALARNALQVPGSEAGPFTLAGAPIWRGWILEELGREAEARTAFEEALAVSGLARAARPESPFAAMLEARAAAALGDADAAWAAYDESVALMGDAARDAYMLGPLEWRLDLLIDLDRHDEAIEIIEELLATDYDYPLTVAALRTDPQYDPLRNHPGFVALVGD